VIAWSRTVKLMDQTLESTSWIMLHALYGIGIKCGRLF
jgi:hypothetical protein